MTQKPDQSVPSRRTFLKSSLASSVLAGNAAVFAGLINTPGVANADDTTAPGTTAAAADVTVQATYESKNDITVNIQVPWTQPGGVWTPPTFAQMSQAVLAAMAAATPPTVPGTNWTETAVVPGKSPPKVANNPVVVINDANGDIATTFVYTANSTTHVTTVTKIYQSSKFTIQFYH